LYITHNLGVVAQICDDLVVLYAGELVERGPTRPLYHQPYHPYTQGLLDSVPRLGTNKQGLRIEAIPGRIPALDALPGGCIFQPRCPLAIEICEQDPPLYAAGDDRHARCHRWEAIARGEILAGYSLSKSRSISKPVHADTATLEVASLAVHFQRRRSVRAALRRQARRSIKAVDDIGFDIYPGETLGLVGESGSGKTTAARAILGLVLPSAGRIRIQDQTLAPGLRKRPLEVRRLHQMVFQNPNEAFNPYLSVGESLSRPLIRLLGMSPQEAVAEARRLLESVQLPAEYADRYPDSLSGGERQRVAIARAFASSPAVLIADEAVSALDVSVQAAILNLLGELQASRSSATLFISHDLAAVGYIADRIAVIYLGQLMEFSSASELFKPPYHPYTEALLSAIPLLDPDALQERIRLSGDIPSPLDRQAGCPFHSRCPRRIGAICRDEKPPWRIGEQGEQIYCHIPIHELATLQKQVFTFRQDKGKAS
jgi:peptide/nickel transport system ATP-binding protein